MDNHATSLIFIFMIFYGNKEQINEFFTIANDFDALLKFSFEISSTSVTYLVTDVYKGERFFKDKILDLKSHCKPTETFQFLPTTSAHPKHTFKSIIIGETIRHIRDNSNESQLNKQLINLKIN